MAANNVIAQVLGSDKKVLDGVSTVAQVRDKMNVSSDYGATVNGEAAHDSDPVADNDFVAFSRKVKGGN